MPPGGGSSAKVKEKDEAEWKRKRVILSVILLHGFLSLGIRKMERGAYHNILVLR